MSALAFAILALCLVGPVPAALVRARWPLRAPRAALVLWQAVAVAAVLSAFSAGIAIAIRIFLPDPGGRLTTFLGEIDPLGAPLWSAYVVVLGLTLTVGGRLILAVVQVGVTTRRRRSHHRMLVDILDASRAGAHSRTGRGDLRILNVEQPLAYCLPGVRSRVVVSEGALSTLDPTEVTAILTHERAHLRARHDLVLEAFTVAHAAFPRFVRSASALDAVRLLIELLADDAAVRTAGPTPLARALVACAAGRAPSGAMAAGGPTTVVRVRRLAGAPNSRSIAVAAYLGAVAVLVLPTVALAIPWLAELQRLLSAGS